jgi:hypothetical protein
MEVLKRPKGARGNHSGHGGRTGLISPKLDARGSDRERRRTRTSNLEPGS